MPSLQIKNLNFDIDGIKILKNINLDMEGEKIYGIIGPNGSGKSTLLKAIYNSFKSRDMVTINGALAKTFTNIEMARHIAFMNQINDSIENDLTVKELVIMGRYPYKKRFESYNSQDEKIVLKILQLIGIIDLAYRPIKNLSGGERQRAILAKTLAQDTDIIMLDEPTNHIDVRYQVELMKILKSLKKLVIVTIHDISLAAKFCDELIVLNRGEILAKGEPRDVLTKDLLKKVYDIDFKILYEPEFIIYF